MCNVMEMHAGTSHGGLLEYQQSVDLYYMNSKKLSGILSRG